MMLVIKHLLGYFILLVSYVFPRISAQLHKSVAI